MTLLRDNVEPLADFLSSRERQARERMCEAQAAERAHQVDSRHRYEVYLDEQAAAHLDAMQPAERELLLAGKAVELRAQYPQATFWTDDTFAALARTRARQELIACLPVLGFRAFVARDQLDSHPAIDCGEDSSCPANATATQ